MGIAILGGAFVLHILGIIDDRKALGPWIKLVVQTIVCSIIVIWFDVRILTAAGPAISCIVTIIWLVLITNSFNFLDNMDGLSAGVAVICAIALLGASAGIGQIFVSAWLCLLIGSLLGFLIWNFPPAKIFMGDAGSLVIGYMMAVLSCLTTYVHWGQPHYMYGVLVPVVLLAMPLYDTISVIIIRLREGRNPLVGDRHHFSHRLVRRGMSVRATVLTIYLVAAATAMAAMLLPRVDAAGAILVFVQTIAILAVVALLEIGSAK
jgi:UDP-GlcNAc:undecaprenyl-phosphate GlcNAc-1-phosphate transferase